MYDRGRTESFRCPHCGGWIPAYSWQEKEVWEQTFLPWMKVCDCGAYEQIRDEMLAVFNCSRVEALRRFRKAARKLGLPDPQSRGR